MPFTATVYRVLIASPSDVKLERDSITESIFEWNIENSSSSGVVFIPIKWETNTLPELSGRPQEIINNQIVNDSDILLGVFWTRIGTDTGVAISGTVEEITRFLEQNKHVMLYFSSAPAKLGSVDFDQYQKLEQFKKDCYTKGIVESYDSIDELISKTKKHLTYWVRNKHTTTNYLTEPQPNNSLSIDFYVSKRIDFSKKMDALQIKTENSPLISQKKIDLNSLYQEILDTEVTNNHAVKREINIDSFTINYNREEYCEYSDVEVEEITRLIVSLLGQTPPKDFFSLGGLKRRKNILSFYSNEYYYEGTDTEKSKWEKINKLIPEMYELEFYIDMINYFSQHKIVPLVLRNIGKAFHEGIKVILRIPRYVEILNADNIKVPENVIIKRFIGKNSVIEGSLRHHSDSKVAENINHENYPTKPPHETIAILQRNYDEESRINTNRYLKYIRSFFNFEIHEDDDDFYHVEYNFTSLNANENISFPSFLLVKTIQNFEVSYRITSKQISETIVGKLDYSIN